LEKAIEIVGEQLAKSFAAIETRGTILARQILLQNKHSTNKSRKNFFGKVS